MNAVATKIEEGAAIADFGASLLDVISRAARDPAVDIDKMERLIAMQERIQARDAELSFNRAMVSAQAEMRPIAANASNPQTKSRYATYDKLDRVLRPIYTQHGFSLSFDEGESSKPDHVRVVCYVSHSDGHTRTYHRDMPADGKGAKGGDVMTKTHAAGAAGSYGARYLLKGIFNVSVGEEDDDGNGASGYRGPVVVNDAQWSELITLIEKSGTDTGRFCAAYNIPSVRELPAAAFPRARKQLNTKLQNAEAANG